MGGVFTDTAPVKVCKIWSLKSVVITKALPEKVFWCERRELVWRVKWGAWGCLFKSSSALTDGLETLELGGLHLSRRIS